MNFNRSLLATLAIGMMVPAIAAAHQFETIVAGCTAGSGKVVVQVQAAFFPAGPQAVTYVLDGLDAAGVAKTVTVNGTFTAVGPIATTISSPGIMGLASVTRVTASYVATDGTTGTATANVMVSGCAPPVVVPPVVPPVVTPPVVVTATPVVPAVIVASPTPVVTAPVTPAPVAVVGTPGAVKPKTTTATRVFRRACTPGSGQIVTTRTTTTFPNGKRRVTVRVTGKCPRPKPAAVAVVG